MAELAATIAALVELGWKVISYVNDIKDGPGDQKRIAEEISGACSCLKKIRKLAKRRSPSAAFMESTRELASPNGPLDQYRACLKTVLKKIKRRANKNRFRAATSALLWPFKKEEVSQLLATLARHRSTFSLALQTDHIELSMSVHQNVLDTQQKVDKVLEKVVDDHEFQERVLADKKKNDVLNWLSLLNFWATQNATFEKLLKDTGNWILEADPLRIWLHVPGKVLWCPGDAGVGKTTLSSVVTDYLRREYCTPESGFALACVYFNYRDHDTYTAQNIIAAILRQLVESELGLPQDIEQAYIDREFGRSRLTGDETSTLLRSLVSRLTRVFIVVDALDECPERHDVRREIIAELKGLGPKASVFITSRPIPLIAKEFQGNPRLDIQAQDGDMRNYIRGRLKSTDNLVRHTQVVAGLAEQIEEGILKTCQRKFLLAELHLNALAACERRADLFKVLSNLPSNYDIAYDVAMNRILEQEPIAARRARQVLLWITHSYRSLNPREIQHATAVEIGDRGFYDRAVVPIDQLVSSCCGLITTRGEEPHVELELVHHTLSEYLKRNRMKYFASGHTEVAEICLTYLSFAEFQGGPANWNPTLKERLDRYALLQYSSQNWGCHAQEASDNDLTEAILAFLGQQNLVASTIQAIDHEERNFDAQARLFLKPSETSIFIVNGAMWLPAYFGLAKVLEYMLQNERAEESVNRQDHHGQTPLFVAIARGHVAAAQLLLDSGALWIHRNDGAFPIHIAAHKGDISALRVCCDNSADINAEDKKLNTALHLSAKSGHLEACQLLLDRGAEITVVNEYGDTPLHDAAHGGFVAVAELLIRKGLSNSRRNYLNSSVLMEAVAGRQLDMVQLLLLDAGVGADIHDDQQFYRFIRNETIGITAESEAHCESFRGVIRGTPLLAAAHLGLVEIFDLLIKYRANPYAQNSAGETALFEAAASDHVDMVQRLLTMGLQPMQARDDGRTPLSIAVRRCCETVPLLLDADPQASVEEDDLDSVLQSSRGREFRAGTTQLSSSPSFLPSILARLSEPISEQCARTLLNSPGWTHVVDLLGTRLDYTEDLVCAIVRHDHNISKTKNQVSLPTDLIHQAGSRRRGPSAQSLCSLLVERRIQIPCTEYVLEAAFSTRSMDLLRVMMAQGAKFTVTASLVMEYVRCGDLFSAPIPADLVREFRSVLLNRDSVTIDETALGAAAIHLGLETMPIEQLARGRNIHITAEAIDWFSRPYRFFDALGRTEDHFEDNLRAVFALPTIQIDEDALVRLFQTERGGDDVYRTILTSDFCPDISQDALQALAKHGNVYCLVLALKRVSASKVDPTKLLYSARSSEEEDMVNFLMGRYPELARYSHESNTGSHSVTEVDSDDTEEIEHD